MVIIYNIILTLILIVFFPIVLLKYKYDRISQQYDFWIHCASLGEVKLALRFIDCMVRKLNTTKDRFLLTTTTVTAKSYAKKFHTHTYIFPLDYLFVIRKCVQNIKPKILIILETELWPNYIYFVKKYNGKIFVINGRMTKRTFVFLKTLKWLVWPMLRCIDYFLVREKIDYIRFVKLGFPTDKVLLTGNMKYDEIDSENTITVHKEEFGLNKDDFLVTFGSIREGEEKLIIKKVILNFANQYKIKFILVPRHINRVTQIVSLLNKYSIKYKLRTAIQTYQDNFDCLVVNTYGELNKIYFLSDIVFVCGSILPYGGQNMIEPASLGKLVVFGKHISNFMEVARLLLDSNAAIQVNNLEDFVKVINKFYQNKEEIVEYGKRAKDVIKKLKGVTERNAEIVTNFIFTL